MTILQVINKATLEFVEKKAKLMTGCKAIFEKALEAVTTSRNILASSGVYEICKICDKEGGSCCAEGIESYYSEPLIIANLMAGVIMPLKKWFPKSCYFLGPTGCILTFRHTLCVNFLCNDIYRQLGIEKVKEVQKVCGLEIDLTFELCETILRITKWNQH